MFSPPRRRLSWLLINQFRFFKAPEPGEAKDHQNVQDLPLNDKCAALSANSRPPVNRYRPERIIEEVISFLPCLFDLPLLESVLRKSLKSHIGSGSNRIKGPEWPDGFPSAPFRAFFYSESSILLGQYIFIPIKMSL